MTPNKSKRKGTDWERGLVKLLNKKLILGAFKKVPGSGAMGTILKEPRLFGDVKGNVYGISRGLLGEAKVGYGGSKQLTLKKEWLDKIVEEAGASFSIPFLAGRFSGCRKGACNFVVLDLDTFCYLLNLVTELAQEIDETYETK
ncbi:hypothetical protein LCGC14_1208590 [marine sediment metagenome]|uniref:Uncharacterized protein n=1 Tax=marine sediment metagenome TaxID=412755 RepID=A0A0F9PJG7_9ZZZZ